MVMKPKITFKVAKAVDNAFQPPCCNSNPMVYFEPHDRLGDPQSRGFWYPRPEIPKPMKPYHRRW